MLATIAEYMKREEFKRELKDVVNPIFDMVSQAVRPYFFYAMLLILLNYTLLASIFFYLVRFKNNISLQYGTSTV
jgi:hypothetical protein